jgi:hypothetical protein
VLGFLHNIAEWHEQLHIGNCRGCRKYNYLQAFDEDPDGTIPYEQVRLPSSLTRALGLGIVRDFCARFPGDYDAPVEKVDFIRKSLQNSGQRCQDLEELKEVSQEGTIWSHSIEAGAEKEYTMDFLQQADHREAEACLKTKQLFGPIRQKVPYPACRWDWKTQDAWKGKHEQHINLLEAQAFLHHLRTKAVAMGVLDKGGSFLYFWTISKGNHADLGSRSFDLGDARLRTLKVQQYFFQHL